MEPAYVLSKSVMDIYNMLEQTETRLLSADESDKAILKSEYQGIKKALKSITSNIEGAAARRP